MAFESSTDDKVEAHKRSSSIDSIEDILPAREHADQFAELPGIESTAASGATWLISITFPIGGLLVDEVEYNHELKECHHMLISH